MNIDISIEKLRQIAEDFRLKRDKLLDGVIIVRSRYEQIKDQLEPLSAARNVLSIPIHVVADDVAATMKMMDLNESKMNRVMVVYQDSIVEANLEAIRNYRIGDW